MKLKQVGIKLRLKLKKLLLDIRQTHLKDIRNAFLLYLKKLPNIIHLRNLVLFNSILSIVVIVMFYQRFTALAPYYQKFEPASGGVYREGVIGNVEKINPLFILNSAESSSVRLVFSGLTRVLPNDQIVPDLAEKWKQIDDTTYDFTLRKGIKWHDGKDFKADDVIFTINLIQNPDTKTSQLAIWKGVKVEKVNDYEVKFTLTGAFPDFLKVASVPIMPQHLLKEIDPKNIKVAEFNLHPVGTGPYKFVRFDQSGSQTEVIFSENDNFAIHKPYLNEVRIKAYESFDDLYNGLIRKQIDGIADVPLDKADKVGSISNLNEYKMFLPRYQVLIFNTKKDFLSDKAVRQALVKAIDRTKIINIAANGYAQPVYSAVLPGQVGYDPKFRKETLDVASANSDLDKLGWLKGQDGTRTKDGKALTFTLVAGDDFENRSAAQEISGEYAQIGVKINLQLSDITLLQSDYLRPRNYDMVLVGQDTGSEADLYSFWHSSQVADPGLNLSGLGDRKMDKLLELARKTSNPKSKADKLIQAQETILDEAPAVYLYNPNFAIAIERNIKGFAVGKMDDSIEHLNSIYDWYINQKVGY